METGIIAYLKAFGLNWGTKLSGIASVPCAVAALFLQTARLRILYGITAAGCFLYSSFELWQNERLSSQSRITLLQAKVDELTANRARLIIYSQNRPGFIVEIEQNSGRTLGCYLQFFLGVENKGGRTSNIQKYALYIREIEKKHDDIQPQPRQHVQGARALYAVIRSDILQNPLSVPGHGIVTGTIPFWTNDVIPPEIQELHCVLTLTDTEGVTAEEEFLVYRLG
jgi:hypothetical protein